MLANGVEPLLERGLLVLNSLEQPSDLAEFGAHAGSDDHSSAAAVGDEGTHIAHILAVAQGHLGLLDRGGVLLNRLRLAGECGLLDAQIDTLDHAHVGGDEVACLQGDYVAGDQVAGRDLLELAIAEGAHVGDGEFLERGDGLLGAVLLEEAEDGKEHNNGEDGPRLEELAKEEREGSGADQDQHHHVRELLPEDAQGALSTFLDELIGAVLGLSSLGDGLAQACGLAAEGGKDSHEITAIPVVRLGDGWGRRLVGGAAVTGRLHSDSSLRRSRADQKARPHGVHDVAMVSPVVVDHDLNAGLDAGLTTLSSARGGRLLPN